jgi:hypothetical protein
LASSFGPAAGKWFDLGDIVGDSDDANGNDNATRWTATCPDSVAASASAKIFSLNSLLKIRRLGWDRGTSAFPKFTTFDISFPSMPTIAETSEEFLLNEGCVRSRRRIAPAT